MPKDKSNRSASHKRKSHVYKPYSCRGKELDTAPGDTTFGDDSMPRKDWEDATCPICMDSPHNTVLLLCSSHDKGCRPYMCDTSYRHSNCLDQYRKAHGTAAKTSVHVSAGETLGVRIMSRSDSGDNNLVRMTRRSGRNLSAGGRSEHEPSFMDVENSGNSSSREGSVGRADRVLTHEKKISLDLLCPLCRGEVRSWTVVEAARQYLNQKARICAQESCLFSGTYEELRLHARCAHPTARPSEVDPARQRDWRRLERQRDLGDVLSTIQSAMPGATLLGDYAIEDDFEHDDSDFPGDEGHWWTFFLLFQVFGPAASITGGRPLPSRLRGLARGQHRSGNMRGESLQHTDNNTNEGNVSTANNERGGNLIGNTRRRRRAGHRALDSLN
eukprot:c29017_g2_i1 orf=346-1506(-)